MKTESSFPINTHGILRVMVLGCFFHFSAIQNGFTYVMKDFKAPDAKSSVSLVGTVFQTGLCQLRRARVEKTVENVILFVQGLSLAIEDGLRSRLCPDQSGPPPRETSEPDLSGTSRSAGVAITAPEFYLSAEKETWNRMKADGGAQSARDRLASFRMPNAEIVKPPGIYAALKSGGSLRFLLRKQLESVVRPLPDAGSPFLSLGRCLLFAS